MTDRRVCQRCGAPVRKPRRTVCDECSFRSEYYGSKSEADWLEEVQDIARIRDWPFIYHTHNSRHSAAGFPDLVLVRPPRIIFAELKREQGVTTREQSRWGEAINQCDAPIWEVWRPTDVDHVHRMLS